MEFDCGVCVDSKGVNKQQTGEHCDIPLLKGALQWLLYDQSIILEDCVTSHFSKMLCDGLCTTRASVICLLDYAEHLGVLLSANGQPEQRWDIGLRSCLTTKREQREVYGAARFFEHAALFHAGHRMVGNSTKLDIDACLTRWLDSTTWLAATMVGFTQAGEMLLNKPVL